MDGIGKGELRNFCVYRMIFGISSSAVMPVMPLFLKSIGMSVIDIGMVISAFGIAKMAFQVPAGIIAEKIGNKKILCISIAFMAAMMAVLTKHDSKNTASLAYIIYGAALGVSVPASYSIMAACIKNEKRGKQTGIVSAVTALSGGIGAALPIWINAHEAVFYISFLGFVFSALYASIMLKGSYACHKTEKGQKIKIRNADRKIFILAGGAFLGDYIYCSISAIFHFYGRSVLGASLSYTSSILSIYLFVFGTGSLLGGWVSDILGSGRQIFISLSAMTLLLFGMYEIRNIGIFTFVIVGYFVAASFLNAGVQRALSEYGNRKGINGFAFGFVGASEAAGGAIGPFVTSFLYSINEKCIFLGMMLMCLLILTLYIILTNKHDTFSTF